MATKSGQTPVQQSATSQRARDDDDPFGTGEFLARIRLLDGEFRQMAQAKSSQVQVYTLSFMRSSLTAVFDHLPSLIGRARQMKAPAREMGMRACLELTQQASLVRTHWVELYQAMGRAYGRDGLSLPLTAAKKKPRPLAVPEEVFVECRKLYAFASAAAVWIGGQVDVDRIAPIVPDEKTADYSDREKWSAKMTIGKLIEKIGDDAGSYPTFHKRYEDRLKMWSRQRYQLRRDGESAADWAAFKRP